MKEGERLNFSTINVSDSKKISKLTKKNFLFGNHKINQHLSIIHNLKMENGLFHLVYHLKDEYNISSNAFGDQFKLPYSSLINLFYKKNSSLVFIEQINKSAVDIVKNELENKSNVTIYDNLIDKNLFEKIYLEFHSQILKFKYIDEEESSNKEEDFITSEVFFNFVNDENCTIKSYTLSIDGKLMTVYRDGLISINNDDEEYLIDIVERLYSCFEK